MMELVLLEMDWRSLEKDTVCTLSIYHLFSLSFTSTSKLLSLADLNGISRSFGFRGEALASISEVSVLEILTRTFGRANGYRKVLKGCKCLYLGIDDDRKEVGTTVVVRDLFHNQPVRRKHVQSSPKKVLQSVKKCMLRVALVHPNILFKVVDIESEDELLCTQSSSSPLSLLTSGFGVDVSSSLHELQDQDDVIKLSGYISGPCNSFPVKALQYIYINSQFINKSPIHKLLSQLAVKFEHLDSRNAGDKFLNKKRSRSQAYPAYILNLLCPRSLYDLTFEPSKTSVQFKDWASILNFIEKAIKNFWGKSITPGESSNATHEVQASQMCKETDDAILVEADIANCGNRKSKEFSGLFLSTSDKWLKMTIACLMGKSLDPPLVICPQVLQSSKKNRIRETFSVRLATLAFQWMGHMPSMIPL
ncbi:DNA mismatch repair protein MLH3 isoform X2 [Neltuma alba]|uniref:DNA mismatch repair protein MLH3 isoform X2 n=1 Tax=Neltuma alba TaxID=207710 RepID=UPI0010A52EE3|nr:DNA mismatch repair protein MLH3-like isoform X2 [Prosopis alba]